MRKSKLVSVDADGFVIGGWLERENRERGREREGHRGCDSALPLVAITS